MFSPYYARACAKAGLADPQNHVAINAVLYRPGAKRWAMTERGRGSLHRAADHFAVGPSSLRWKGDDLIVEIDEWSVPVPRRLRGTITIRPHALGRQGFDLDPAHRHHWRPVAPSADVECSFSEPGIAFRGHGYVDMNSGSEPLAKGFRSWTWSRSIGTHSALIGYDVALRGGGSRHLTLAANRDGSITETRAPGFTPLEKGRVWRVARAMRSDAERPATILRTLEDTPFYTRSLVRAAWNGERHAAIMESVDLDRFSSRWVQTLLPFRMPRLR